MSRSALHRENLIKTIRDLVKNPENYDAFITSWQAVIASESDTDPNATKNLADIEDVAQLAIAAIAESEEHLVDGHQSLVPVEALKEPAFVVDANGVIEDLNDIAWQQFGMEPKGLISAIDLEFSNSNELMNAISARAFSNTAENSPGLIHATKSSDNTQVAILLIRVAGKTASAPKILMVVNTGQDAKQSALMLKESFGLTENEHAVLQHFLDGQKLTEIAKVRGRSHQTIRNQMQSIFEKCGCSSQSEMMRMAFSLSTVLATLMPVVEDVKRNLRRPVSFLRPDGRMVDALLAGARHGQVVISLPSIFGHPLTSEIEEKLAKSDISMICIARPGMGKSDPVPKPEDEADCLAEDIKSILDQLQKETCILLGRASCTPLVFALTNRIPEKFSRVLVVNAVVPAPFLETDDVASSWTRSLITAARNSSSVARLILRSGRRLMRVIGPATFLKRMYSHAPSDVDVLDRADVVESIEEGAQMVTAQGFDAGSRDMVVALNDWSADVETCPLKVSLIQGSHDPNVPLEASYRFAEKYPKQCELTVIEGGGLLSYSHVDNIIAAFK